MKKILLIMAIILISSIAAISSNILKIDASKFIDYKSKMDIKNFSDEKKPCIQTVYSNEEVKVFTINYQNFQKIISSDFQVIEISNFPISTLNSGTIVLERAKSVVDENTRLFRGTVNGKFQVKMPEIYSFNGKLKDEEGSRIFITYSDGLMYGLIEHNDGFQYNLSAANSIDSKYEMPHILTSHESLVPSNIKDTPFSCLTLDYSGIKRETDFINHKENENKIQYSSKLLEVPLILEGTYQFYNLLGNNLTKASVYMAAVIGLTSKIYEEQLNCFFTIKDIYIWEDKASDPYSSYNLLSDKLEQMPTNWSNDATPRALVSLFASLAAQGGASIVAGISMGGEPGVGSLCSRVRGYNVFGIRNNVKYPTMNYSWDVNCAAHEIGHNFSAPHTHNCYYAPNTIDTCVTKDGGVASAPDACYSGKPIPRLGTLMSYCHLGNTSQSVALMIHPRQLGIMRQAVEKNSACVSEPKTATLKLLTFLGDKTYLTDSEEEIRWTSTKVNNVKISFSTDNGVNWQVIADNLVAGDSIFKWKIPTSINTTKGMMKVQDINLPTLFDTSKTVFTIASTSIKVNKPIAEEKFAIKESIVINWTASLIDAFTVSVSNDNGSSWQTIANNIKSSSYSWDNHPNSGKYMIKVASSANPEFYSITGPIEIGTPKLKIVKPATGETFCWNRDNEIVWTSEFINTIYLQFSVDNGANWQNVVLGTQNANLQKFIWKPKQSSATNKALLKISAGYDKNETLDSTKYNYSIDSCIVGVNEFELLSGIKINGLIPNPLINSGILKISNNNNIFVNINSVIINDIGEEVKHLEKFTISPNSNYEIKINVNDLANGNYFVLIKTNNGNLSYPLRIFR